MKKIDMEKVKQARENLDIIAREHPELTNQDGDYALRLRERIFDVTVDKDKMVFQLDEVAELLGVHPESVRRWIRAGKLSAAKTGKQYLISRSDLQAFWKDMGGATLFDGDHE